MAELGGKILKPTYIYFLLDPRTNGIRYVGYSQRPESRFSCHIENRQKLADRMRILMKDEVFLAKIAKGKRDKLKGKK